MVGVFVSVGVGVTVLVGPGVSVGEGVKVIVEVGAVTVCVPNISFATCVAVSCKLCSEGEQAHNEAANNKVKWGKQVFHDVFAYLLADPPRQGGDSGAMPPFSNHSSGVMVCRARA